jgi:predicted aminopeptidase
MHIDMNYAYVYARGKPSVTTFVWCTAFGCCTYTRYAMLSTKQNNDAQVQVQGLVYDCYFYRNTEALQGIGRLFE